MHSTWFMFVTCCHPALRHTPPPPSSINSVIIWLVAMNFYTEAAGASLTELTLYLNTLKRRIGWRSIDFDRNTRFKVNYFGHTCKNLHVWAGQVLTLWLPFVYSWIHIIVGPLTPRASHYMHITFYIVCNECTRGARDPLRKSAIKMFTGGSLQMKHFSQWH